MFHFFNYNKISGWIKNASEGKLIPEEKTNSHVHTLFPINVPLVGDSND